MNNSEMFQSPNARALMQEWAARFSDQLSVPGQPFTCSTTFGETNGLAIGPEEGRPLVVLHGAMASSAHVVRELGPLISRRRIIAFDVLGQSPLSEDRRLDLHDDSYGGWLEEACDAVQIDDFDLLGVSWGGFAAMKGVDRLSHRIKKLVLLVPAGLVSGSVWKGFWKMGLPMMRQIKSPSPQNLRRVVEPLFTTIDPLWEEYFGAALASYRMDMRVPPLRRQADWSGPTLVMGAEDDLSFPGRKLLKRASELMPQCETELLEGSRHCPPFTDEFRSWLAGRIDFFLG